MADAIGELDDHPLLGRQASQRYVQPLVDFVPLCGLLTRNLRLDVGIRGRGTRMAQRLQASPIGDPEDPGGYSRGTAKVAGMLPDDPERVVDDLFCKLASGGEPHEKSGQSPMVEKVQLIDRGAVASCNASEKGAFELVGRGSVCGPGGPLGRHRILRRLR